MSDAAIETGAGRRGRTRHRGRGLIVPVGLLILWEIAAHTSWAPEFLVAPSAILRVFFTMAADGQLWPHVVASLTRAFGGFALGLVAGVALGLFAGSSRIAGTFFDPLISLLYPVPKVAFLPIIIIWLGLGDVSKIVTISLSVVFPIFINSYAGTLALNRTYIWAARNMGASRWRIFWRVILPASLPHILSGARIGLGLAFVVLFATELFGARSGLGYLIGLAELGHRYDIMYVAIICIGLAGFLSDRLLVWLGRRLLVGQNLAKADAGG